MEGLAERTWRVLRSHEGAVLDLSSVVRVMRADGCAVTEWVLQRALETDRTRFLVVRPWRGRLGTLGGYVAARERLDGSDETTLKHDGTGRQVGPVLVVVDPYAGAAAPSPVPRGRMSARVRRSLVLLGRRLDQHSTLDRLRWLRMLTELAPQDAP
jgi:hypothetical protein